MKPLMQLQKNRPSLEYDQTDKSDHTDKTADLPRKRRHISPEDNNDTGNDTDEDTPEYIEGPALLFPFI